MRRCAEVFFEAGAEEVLLLGRKELILKAKGELGRIDNEIRDPRDLLVVGTGHPQGGNPMSDAANGFQYRGVVGTDFKVHGVENLYVCDASVFPTSIKVNPQWTIMALADLCAAGVLAEA
jgi:choline dehydrogenase-like flavoprotein